VIRLPGKRSGSLPAALQGILESSRAGNRAAMMYALKNALKEQLRVYGLSSFHPRELTRVLRRELLGRRCLVCGVVRGNDTGSDTMCPLCLEKLKIRRRGFCPGCAKIFTLEETEPYYCLDCRTRPFPWSGLGFFGPYRDRLRELILLFKFKGDLGLGSVLGSMLVQACIYHGGLQADMVVPVPMHDSKLKKRGFNQSLELARVFSASMGRKLQPRAMVKKKPTAAQSSLKRKDRMKELRGAFEADSGVVRGQSVLLVDDICTTGSTLEECTGTIIKAGASRVQVLFLARGVM